MLNRRAFTATLLVLTALASGPARAIVTDGDPTPAITQLNVALRGNIKEPWKTTLFDAESGTLTALGATIAQIDPGTPSVAYLTLNAANPTDTDTLTIGDDVYEFATAAGSLASDTNIGVVIGGTKGATLTNLIAAINGDVTAATGLFKTDGTTPALKNGTELYVADDLGSTVMRLRSADAVGANVICRADTTVLSETFTSASNIWDVGSGHAINAGRAPEHVQYMCASRAVTASHLSYGSLRFSFANQAGPVSSISRVIVQLTTSAGLKKYPIADATTVSGSDVIITLAGTGAPEAVATDVYTVWVAVGD